MSPSSPPPAPSADLVHCAFCGADFPPERAGKSACAACLIGKAKGADACGFLKCPSCGYEIPIEPRWVSATRSFLSGLFGRRAERLGA